MNIEDVQIGKYVKYSGSIIKHSGSLKVLVFDTNQDGKVNLSKSAVAFLIPKGLNPFGFINYEYEKKLATSILLQWDIRWLHCDYLNSAD
jgi:hypothetical protein